MIPGSVGELWQIRDMTRRAHSTLIAEQAKFEVASKRYFEARRTDTVSNSSASRPLFHEFGRAQGALHGAQAAYASWVKVLESAERQAGN